MRSAHWIAVVGLVAGVGGCAVAVDTKEGMFAQAGFRKIPADTPQRIAHLETIRPHRLIKRSTDGKTYYVYADPDQCRCLYVGSEAAYAKYKTLVQRQEDAMALEEARQEEAVEGAK